MEPRKLKLSIRERLKDKLSDGLLSGDVKTKNVLLTQGPRLEEEKQRRLLRILLVWIKKKSPEDKTFLKMK